MRGIETGSSRCFVEEMGGERMTPIRARNRTGTTLEAQTFSGTFSDEGVGLGQEKNMMGNRGRTGSDGCLCSGHGGTTQQRDTIKNLMFFIRLDHECTQNKRTSNAVFPEDAQVDDQVDTEHFCDEVVWVPELPCVAAVACDQELHGPSPAEPAGRDEFKVFIVKRENRSILGLKVHRAHNNCRVRVAQVGQGLLQDWNDAHPERSVMVGDLLVEVNGVRGPTSRDITQEVECSGILELTFQFSGRVEPALFLSA